MSSVFVLVRDIGNENMPRSVELSISAQKGFFSSFEAARNQAVGEEFPLELYRGYDNPRKENKRRKQELSGASV